MTYLNFATADDLERWLRDNHAEATELWVRIFKKGSGHPSITWDDCVIACIAWGWIDGQKKSLDATSYLQRITPRRARSNWSKKNTAHAEALIAAGRMSPAGMAHVTAAKADGRWEAAYAGQADMVIPQDFLEALQGHPVAKATFDGMTRAGHFAIYHRLTTAKKPETRAARFAKILDSLNRGEAIR